MRSAITSALITAVVTLIIGVLTVYFMRGSYQVQVESLQIEKEKLERERNDAQRTANTYRKLLEEAPTKFTDTMGTLIEEASKEVSRTEGPSQIVSAAKALVSTRTGFRSALESIKDRLNSDIDDLERELSNPTPDLQKVGLLVEVLKRKWPAKKQEIEVAVRKLITELGLTPR